MNEYPHRSDRVYHLLSNIKLLDTNWKQKFLVCGVIGYP